MATATDFDRALWQRLLDGSPTASAEAAELYLAPLVQAVRARHREVQDQDWLVDAATDALLDFTERPATYDPEKLPLLSFLTMAANRDLLNRIDKEGRRSRRVVSLSAVADHGSARNRAWEPATEDDLDLDRLDADPARQALLRRALAEFPDPRDRQLLGLMLDGERKTGPYAAILGIEGQDVDTQRREVKRHKDRLKKRLARLGEQIRERT